MSQICAELLVRTHSTGLDLSIRLQICPGASWHSSGKDVRRHGWKALGSFHSLKISLGVKVMIQ